jgi:hypothetical protein
MQEKHPIAHPGGPFLLPCVNRATPPPVAQALAGVTFSAEEGVTFSAEEEDLSPWQSVDQGGRARA